MEAVFFCPTVLNVPVNLLRTIISSTHNIANREEYSESSLFDGYATPVYKLTHFPHLSIPVLVTLKSATGMID
jgi:hypothetical protein